METVVAKNLKLEDIINNCEHKHTTIDYERGEEVCRECGLVIVEGIIDSHNDARYYSREEELLSRRTGDPTSKFMHDRGLSTGIDFLNKDYNGTRLNASAKRQMNRLRRWHRRTRFRNSSEKNLATGFADLKKIASYLSLPLKAKEEAALIFRKAVDGRILVGRDGKTILAAAIYAACRQCKVPRSLTEISEQTNVEEKDIGKLYKLLVNTFGLQCDVTNAFDYLPRFCSELEVSTNITKKAYNILECAEEAKITIGKNPTGLAAASIYLSSKVCKERVIQKEIAKVAGITEVTIRNRYKEMANKLKIAL